MELFLAEQQINSENQSDVSALIPVAGAYIGGALGAFMIFTVDPLKALIFLVFLVILQQIEGNLIYPRVVGNSIGLPGLWVLAAVTVGGGVLGVSGMLLGVPLSAALYKIFADDVKRRAADMEQYWGVLLILYKRGVVMSDAVSLTMGNSFFPFFEQKCLRSILTYKDYHHHL